MALTKKILVTGGAGYIGAHTVVELINAGYEPVIIDDLSKSDRTLLEGIEKITGKKVNFQKGDCCDKVFVRDVFKTQGPFSSVLHFAAYKSVGESVQIPLTYYQNNIDSLVTMLAVMKENNVTDFIFSSSCTVYGQPDQIPVNESAPFKRAESPYGATKQMCERILEDAHLNGYRVISLRYFNPVGAHPSAQLGELPIGAPNNLVPYVTQTAAGVREKLTVFGNDYNTPDGSCLRDFIHVVDLAIAHVKAMEYLAKRPEDKLCEAFNVGTGVGVSVLQLIDKFEKATGVKFAYTIGPRRPGDVEKVYADPAKVNAALNWKTKYTLEESLLHAWQWEKKIRNIQ
ncbi:UDP-glucose 4-epimerase GalE [Chryseolinea lacunae]|uniref:UDP-glucose 4-epimerase n=1 Tax=Chryseolinea lacunae TaxID=2801331 RepID=A0ABS1KRU7_9BACT|nr:UDP-glucose 4-epimerase GalE [Chryseolinea lacunae]MBL0742203.1 UDP-glucose 4-epimerase GalE [Chryseolinea lacunae]